ncbi:hypothetical protein PAXRUDRAFT_572931 [Paxillus rubicundulus Ve08.2h10]|uniref:Zinc finger PHD-type domain-containing protein n=1 Tax=Paxillus rubicundulus Ve08.2h10 TaxID=930991 RepID=A0A0D0DLY9_9AGAM|nr:hypothetical protein PAXRUDRAFT_572931 [Paxillus rubicundulus Ve08.2h10]
MNSDATEAALGLLGLSPLNAPQSQPQPHHPHVAHAHGPSLTSSAVGIAIDRRTSSNHVQSALPPLFVPLKRKQSSPALPATTRGISAATATPLPISTSRDALSIKSAQRQSSHPLATSSTPPIQSTHPLPNVSTKSSAGPSRRYSQQRSFSPSLTTSLAPQTLPTPQLPLASPSTSQHPLSLADAPPPDSDAISCICGFTYDDGFSIACDDCSRWCHAACFGIVQGEVPEFWKCWVCNPEVQVDKERAVKIQKGRLKAMRLKASHGANGGAAAAGSLNEPSMNTGTDDGSAGTGKPVSRRKTSPGVERKPRRGSAVAAAIDGSGPSKKRRRASILAPANPSMLSAMGSPTSNQAGPSTQPNSFHASSSRISLFNEPPAANAHPTPITFPPDIYPHPSTHAQLLRVARAWRGVTALNPPLPLVKPPETYIDGGYTRVASQEYSDRYGYCMSPLDNTTPVILDENAGDIIVPRTVLRTDPPPSHSQPLRYSPTHSYSPSHLYPNSHLLSNTPSAATHTPSSSTHTPPHLLRPPSPRLHVAAEPSPFVQSSICATSSTNTTPSLNTHSTPSLNTSHTIPASTLLAPYTATIVPSSAYLADPLNGYAHLGMGKPQVRLVGGGWGVGIDARERGSRDAVEFDKGDTAAEKEEHVGGEKARWARCGCWPNAVLRPVICAGTRAAGNKGEKGRQHRAGCGKAGSKETEAAVDIDIRDNEPPRTPDDELSAPLPKTQPRAQSRRTDDSSDKEDPASDSDTDPTSLSFALFALRDLKAEEEIVLGWEWDDGHAVHMLPALMESPGMFGPAYLHHLRAQFTSILHALSSTFTTCACGSSTRDCAVRVMERVVEGRWPWPGREMTPEGSGDESSEREQGWEDGDVDVDVEGDGDARMAVDLAMEIDIDGRPRPLKKRRVRKKSKDKDKGQPNLKGTVDLGPLVGVERGFRTREKVPMSGGWCGVEVVPSSLAAFPELGTDSEGKVSGPGKEKGRGGKAGKSKAYDVPALVC